MVERLNGIESNANLLMLSQVLTAVYVEDGALKAVISRCPTLAENGARVDKAVDKAHARGASAMRQVRLAQLGPASAEQRLD